MMDGQDLLNDALTVRTDRESLNNYFFHWILNRPGSNHLEGCKRDRDHDEEC